MSTPPSAKSGSDERAAEAVPSPRRRVRMERSQVWLVTSVLVLMSMIPLLQLVHGWITGNSLPLWVVWAVLAAVFVFSIAVAGYVLVRAVRLWTPLIEHGCRLCLRCHYPLPEEHASGTCPECGLGYELEATIAAWREGGLATRRR